MTDRCEPPPELRDRDGWHWVEAPHGKNKPWFWWADAEGWETHTPNPIDAGKRGWRYVSPALIPAEAAALRAERDALREEKAELVEELETVLRQRQAARAALGGTDG